MKKKQVGRRAFFKTGGAISVGLAMAPLSRTMAANRSSNDTSNTEINPTKYITYPKAKCPMELGLGFNWFEHLGSGGYYARRENYPLSTKTYPDLEDAKGWAAVKKGLDELNPGWFRFGLPPDPHVDANGKFKGNTIHFKHLEWLDKWACENNKTIQLDNFLIPRYYEFSLPEGTKEPGSKYVNMAAENNREYATNFVAPMIDYVVNKLNLKSVKFFNPVNEPMQYGVYQTPNNEPVAMVHYVEMYREMRHALDDIGITRDRIGLIGFDTSHGIKFALEELSHKIDISPYIEAYSVHHYNLRLDYITPETVAKKDVGRNYFVKGMNVTIEQDDKMFLEFARKQNLPLWALEMGTFYYGMRHNPAGVASIDATLTVAEGIIRATNIGIPAFCLWSLLNPNNVDGHWAVMGVKDGELIKHKYPFAVYGLISNHMTPGSIVYPVHPSNDSPVIVNVHATFLEAPDGEKSMLVVNDDPKSTKTAEFKLPEGWKNELEFIISIANAEKLNEPAGKVKVKNGTITLTISPFSLLGLKSR